MGSYQKLINNSFVFALGNLGSKLIALILVPMYTYYLSTVEYGTVDLIMTTVSMLVPIVSFSIFEAILRFVMDREKSRTLVITNALIIVIIGVILALLVYPFLSYYNLFGNNLIYLYIIMFLQICEQMFAQYARATGQIKIFAINGILLTLSTGIFNILFLVYFGFGLKGYFIANVVSNIISVVFLISSTKVYTEIKFKEFDKKTIKELLAFSIPIIPNSIMWWLVNASSRYFILYFVGVSANGLFAVASKVPALINIINQIFMQAWQISAIEEYESENKAHFYSNVFIILSTVLFIGTSAVNVVMKIMFSTLFAEEYFVAWRAVPFLLLGTVFSSFSGFLGTNYIVAKQTKGVLKTSMYGGVVSVILNLIFIPSFGIIGAGISSMISFFVIFVIRYYDTKKYIEFHIDWILLFKNFLVILTQICVLMLSIFNKSNLIIQICLFLLLLVLNRKTLILFVEMIRIYTEKLGRRL